MNNKGQVLVLFVLILPVLLLGFVIGIDLIGVSTLKQSTQNEIREIIYSGIKNNKSLDEINFLIDQNIVYKDKDVFKTDNNLKIKIVQDSTIFGRNFELNYSYEGFIDNENIVIREG